MKRWANSDAHRVSVERARQQKALRPIAAQVQQRPGRSSGLDAFGDDVEAEGVGQRHNLFQDRQVRVGRIRPEVSDEFLVNFERVDRK